MDNTLSGLPFDGKALERDINDMASINPYLVFLFTPRYNFDFFTRLKLELFEDL